MAFQPKLIAGNHFFLEFGAVNSPEIGNLAFIFFLAQDSNCTDLCQGLHNQHARHNRLLRKVAGKKRLVVSN